MTYFADVINLTYNAPLLEKVVIDIVHYDRLFDKTFPISTFNREQRQQIFKVLNIDENNHVHNVLINFVTVACLKPKQMSAIHIDRDAKGVLTPAAINIPITKCDNVYMSWYVPKSNRQTKTIKSASGFDIVGLSRNDADVIFSMQCNKPVVVNPTTFHDIINHGNSDEVIISLRS